MLDHAALWTAIDRLAAREGISVSALARRAGLDPTSFNPSKRRVGNRPRWPSTESLMQVLRSCGLDIAAFAALAENAAPRRMPLWPAGTAAKFLSLPDFDDPRLCAFRVTARHQPCPYAPGTLLLLRSGATPRRKRPVVLRLKSRRLRIGILHPTPSLMLTLATGTATETISRDDVIECCEIVWTRQGAV